MKNIPSIASVKNGFPDIRLRRNRQYKWLRDLVAETTLTVNDLIQVLFVRDAVSEAHISSMPGVKRYTSEEIVDTVGTLVDSKIPAVALFPYYEKERRSENVVQMLTPENSYCEAIRQIKKAHPDVGVIVDVALDTYATHGQDGIVRDGQVLNDETLEIISDYAVVLAEAGADIIAPSDMMDGRIHAIRRKLDNAGHHNVAVLSYAAKYASSFYSPFRDAVGSKECLGLADKCTYQLDPRNQSEALREVALDLAEGADMVMVKPGLPYLDIIQTVKETFQVPTFAFQISGEYAMLKAASEKGWLDFDSCLMETLISMKRAGADGILTYASLDAAKLLKAGS